jgi:hypothetical protein
VDTVALSQEDDFWNGGTAWLLAGGNGVGNQMARVSDFTASSDTLTLTDTLATAAADLTSYAVAGKRYSLMELIAAVNEAVYSLGKIIYTRTADLPTAAAQTEYSLVEQTDTADLPVVIDAEAELLEVWFQGDTGDADSNLWYRADIPWYVQKSNIGTMNVLVFEWQPTSVIALKLVLKGQHPYLFQFGVRAHTELDQGVPFQLVTARAAFNLLKQELNYDLTHPRLVQMQEVMQGLVQKTETEHAPLRVPRRPRLLMIENAAYAGGGDPFPPIPTS